MWFATHDVSTEKDKLSVFSAEPASAELSFPFWIGFAVIQESGDIHIYFFSKKSLFYITETGPADESFVHGFRKVTKKMIL